MQPENEIVAATEFAAAPDRRHRRRSVLWPVEIASKPGIRCTITDVSIAGAKMLVSKPLAEGESIVIRSRRFIARATVAWVREGTVGLEFHEANERLERALDAP
jgi:PilZ domain